MIEMKKISKKIITFVGCVLAGAFFAGGCFSDGDTANTGFSNTPQIESDMPIAAAQLGNTNTVLNILLDNIKDDTSQKFILYISGIDVWGGQDIVSRSDVNLLVSVNRETGEIKIVNTPRDSYVLLPDSGDMRDKLTHAGLYGIESSEGALENLYGIDIDYYLKLNFSGFEKIIDTLGGIDVMSEQEFTVEPIKDYVKGINHLTGIESLAFVRERKSFSDGDNQRGRHQMEMAKAVIKALSSAQTLTKFSDFLKETDTYYLTDMPQDLIISMANTELIRQRSWDIETYAVKGSGDYKPTYSIQSKNLYVTVLDDDNVKEAGELLNNNIDR